MKKLVLAPYEIVQHTIDTAIFDNFITTKLSEAGFDLDKGYRIHQDHVSREFIYTQED